MSARPWYHEGLRFSCSGCGHCCSGEPGAVWLNDAEVAAMASHLGLEVAELEARFVRVLSTRRSLRERPSGDCVLFDADNRHCSVYPARPTQCRTWPFWQANLEAPADWKTVCAECPGAQPPESADGEHHSEDDVRRRLALLAAARG